MKLRQTEKLGRAEAKAGAGGWHAGTHRHGHRPTERGGRQRKHTPRRAEEDTGDNRELGSLTGPVTFLPADSPPDLHRLPSLQPWRPFRTPACISTQGEASWSSASTTAGVIPRSLGNWAHLPLRRRGLPVVPQGCGWSSQRFCASIKLHFLQTHRTHDTPVVITITAGCGSDWGSPRLPRPGEPGSFYQGPSFPRPFRKKAENPRVLGNPKQNLLSSASLNEVLSP